VDWSDVVVLRAYRRYRRQVGSVWSDRQLIDPLVEFPEVATALLGYYAARFDPSLAAGAPAASGEARVAVEKALASVERLEQDQVLRAYLSLVDATMRTSHYARAPGGERLPTLTMKLDSTRVPELPPPRPFVEAFVYSPRIEGLHLRGGPVARGGIRWSDRQDDLRTEVLGLVRAQVLKNAGIVPTGAKGGFVCRRLALSDSARAEGDEVADAAAEVRACYQLFIEGLLDITDNVVGGQVRPPAGVRPADGEDSYLVVAADKGTATFSDLANAISVARGFWLGDAFASGGGHGYDHKAMGITARGAWEVARQHFRQLGIDPEAEEIRVMGVGDMSGDVFGNGMLRSRTMKLIAAFDHRDVFVDPDPDPARSFVERCRLFALPRSSWQDYDRAVLSPGGGVWSRTTKEITLSPEARAALGITAATVTPPQLIAAILTASADLLWFGGIGTFVKAPQESAADVGDRANDAVRVDADQVRARIIVEGGNLAVTPRARIAYSRRGGKINADFVDNAAGVDTSDYEVNLKILLAQAIEQGRIAAGERDGVLRSVQDDVAGAVLRDVGLTAVAVTRAVPASAADIDAYQALMAHLEHAGRLDRRVESLPDDEDLAQRRAAGAGLTRPEAAVLLALAKSDLADALEQSPLVASPAVHDAVVGYFPAPVADRFADLLAAHRLYRPLAATRVASDMVDRMGVTWAHETAEEFGVDLASVGRAYWAGRHVLGADERWRRVEALAPAVSPDAESLLHAMVAHAVDALARRYVVEGDEHVYDDRAVVEALDGVATGDAAAIVAAGVSGAAPDADADTDADTDTDTDGAAAFARLPALALAADIGAVTRARQVSVAEALGLVGAFEAAVGAADFRAALDRRDLGSRWGRWQARRLKDDVADLRRRAALAAASGPGSLAEGPAAAMAAWLAAPAAATARARYQRLMALLADPEADVLCVAALAVRALADLTDHA
jgi:glutamate dehydrogenase